MYLHFKTVLVFLITSLLPVLLHGQGNDYVVHVDAYTVNNGLGSNHVLDCFQDSRGILWIVRDGGVERFDGEEFKHFDFPELKNTSGMCFLLEDSAHDLWIRQSNKTVFFLNVYTEQLKTSDEKFGNTFPKEVDWAIPGIEHSYLLQDAASNIYRYYPGKTPVLYYCTPGKMVSPLVEFDNGIAWSECNDFGKGGYLVATDKNGKEKIKINYQAEHIYAKGVWGHDTIHYLTKDSFYLASLQGIVLRKSIKSFSPGYEFTDPYKNGQFQKLVVEQDRGLVWMFFPYQVMVFDKSLHLLYSFDTKKHFVQSSTVFDLFVDNQDHTWLCTFDGLYNINFKSNPFHSYLNHDPANRAQYTPESVRKICKAADGNIYVIAPGRLCQVLPGGRTKAVLRFPDTGGEVWLSMDSDDRGNLWFPNLSLYQYNVFTKKLIKHSSIIGNNWMAKKVGNLLWFGYPLTAIDLSSGAPSRERRFAKFDGIDRMVVYDIVQRNEREYLVATENGLYLLDTLNGTTAHYWEGGTKEFYLPASDIRHIHQDKSGDYWMATSDGLLFWRPSAAEYRLYGPADGVQTYCNAVLEDDYGFLWISSNFGLMQFDKASKHVRTYLLTDGLPSDEFNRLSYFKDASTGDMYMGGINGLVKFHPRDFLQQATQIVPSAQLVLTECMLFSGKTNKEENIRSSVQQDGLITINPGDLFLRIKFALTDYTKPSGITYAYLIDGYNKNWHVGKENELLISGLPYGKYTLRVKAVYANGLNYEKEMQITIRVWPPFYRQPWFIILCALLSVLILVLYIRRRTRLLIARTTTLEGMVRERTEVIENQRQSLKKLYDSKSRLYANITHEFRTPLTLIIGPAQQALNSAEVLDRPGIKHSLSNILQNGEQLLGLVNQMLDLNKLESKAMSPQYYQADILAFLQQIVEKFQHYAASRNISCAFYADRPELTMDFDSEMVEKVFNNLLSNAVKFTPDGGNIVVTAKVSGDRLSVEVKDSGNGIAPEQVPFIFDRYYQADNSSTRRSEGTGIGLALVKELVDLLEGTISVESIPGRGTAFTLQLPVRNTAPGSNTPALSTGMNLQGSASIETQAEYVVRTDNEPDKPSVIVIEDHPAVANFIASCLADRYTVSIQTDSPKGLVAVQEQLPDLVICDLMMPEMDGYLVCSALKTDERTSHIPVVFLSAVTEQAERLKRLNAGADAYISKPFQAEELQAVAAGLLQSRKRLREKYLAISSGAGPKDSENGVPAETLNQVDVEFLNKARAAVLTYLEKSDFDGMELARKIGFSNSQLHRKLTALTGLPAGRFIYQVRLGVARDLLRRKELAISDIAYQTGFSDPAYFTRMFTKTFGLSPRKYRAETSDPPDKA